MRHFAALLLPFALVLAGCPTEPPPRIKEPPAPTDEWSGIEASPEWLYATKGFSGDKKHECEHVLEGLRNESRCKGALCDHARDLAKGWRTRCKKIDSDQGEEVATLSQTLSDQADSKPDTCADTGAAILREGCKKGTDCTESAQHWATRCAQTVGSPLVVRMIERTVERSLEEGTTLTLDVRSCDEMRAEVTKGALCDHEFKCQDAIAKLDPYRARCEGGGDKPSIATAAFEAAILSGAKKGSPPIGVTSEPAIAPAEMVGALVDGWGAVLWACDQRVLDLGKYLETRSGCQAGTLVAARAFKTKAGDVEVRLGTLALPNDEVLRARVPWLVVVGEKDARDKTAAASLDVDLAKIIASSKQKGGEAEAMKALARAIRSHATALRKSEAVRARLSAHVDDLMPLLRALGKAKAVAARKLTGGELLAFARRAVKHPFADVGAEGAVEAGAISGASDLEIALALASAMPAYLEELEPFAKTARTRKPAKKDLDRARATLTEQATACGAAEKKAHQSERGLVACAFGFATCDGAKVDEFGKGSDQARASAEEAWRRLIGSAVDDATASEMTALAKQSECTAPWW